MVNSNNIFLLLFVTFKKMYLSIELYRKGASYV